MTKQIANIFFGQSSFKHTSDCKSDYKASKFVLHLIILY